MAAKKAKKTAKNAAKKTAKKAKTPSTRKASAVKSPRKKAAAKKKAGARKKAPAKKIAAKRGPGRPPGGDSKTRGSQTSRRQIRQIAHCILQESKGKTRGEASALTGAHVDDIKNLKAGNLPSLKLLLRVIRNGHFDPEALIKNSNFKKLPSNVSTRNARSKLIAARIRKLAKEREPAKLAKQTGLSIYTIYQHRVVNKRVGLHTILSFIQADAVSAREIFLGR
ncbi:MAG: hypothetical protein IH973_07835 [Myxococcales bacterium]|nr:hypothetical protein [Myxococcales bacterium]